MLEHTITDSPQAASTGVDDLLAAPDRLLPAALTLLESEHERGQQVMPGHSSIGGCPREAAYGLQGVPADPEWAVTPSISSWIGQAVHRTLLPALATLLSGEAVEGATYELAVPWTPALPSEQGLPPELRRLPPITGHVDLPVPSGVIDLKTVSRHGLDRAKREGPKGRNLLQVHSNAAGLIDAGRDITWVGLLLVCTESSLDRQDHNGLLYVQPLDPALVASAAEWWRGVVDSPPEQQERTERGPGLSFACDECRWLRRCWGPDAEPGRVGPQSLLAVESDAVVSALTMYQEAGARITDAGRAERAAKADQEWARALIAGADEGTYVGKGGRMVDLRIKPGSTRLDQAEARAALEAAGLPVPMKRDRDRVVITDVQ